LHEVVEMHVPFSPLFALQVGVLVGVVSGVVSGVEVGVFDFDALGAALVGDGFLASSSGTQMGSDSNSGRV
jgi:hypothetical protein